MRGEWGTLFPGVPCFVFCPASFCRHSFSPFVLLVLAVPQIGQLALRSSFPSFFTCAPWDESLKARDQTWRVEFHTLIQTKLYTQRPERLCVWNLPTPHSMLLRLTTLALWKSPTQADFHSICLVLSFSGDLRLYGERLLFPSELTFKRKTNFASCIKGCCLRAH